MTELLLGTRKGLFVLEGEPGGAFEVGARAFAGETVEFAMRDERTGRVIASVTSAFYGPKLWHTDDPAGEWEQASGVELPEGGDAALERIWTIAAGETDGVVYAGGDPGVLFESRDGGQSFELNRGLWEHESRPRWQPGGGGLCLHSISTWPGEPDRLAVAISAAGVWLTEDGGDSWRNGNEGLVANYLPEDAPPDDPIALCVHRLHRAPHPPRADVHAVPRRGLSLRRRGRVLDEHRRRPPVRLRLPARDRSRGSRQRLPDPAHRGHRPRDAGQPCAYTRPATPARAGPPAAMDCRRRTPT